MKNEMLFWLFTDLKLYVNHMLLISKGFVNIYEKNTHNEIERKFEYAISTKCKVSILLFCNACLQRSWKPLLIFIIFAINYFN